MTQNWQVGKTYCIVQNDDDGEVHLSMKNGMTLVRIDVPEELSASFIRVTRIGELGTRLAATSNRRDINHENCEED
jgi:hypothetical protein